VCEAQKQAIASFCCIFSVQAHSQPRTSEMAVDNVLNLTLMQGTT
jgi:hypothetical protein